MKTLFALPKILLLFPVLALCGVCADAQALESIKSQVTLGKEKLTESIKNNICGKVTRELVPGSLQVHHMKGYGAVEMGVHRFHHPGHDDTEPVGEGKFIHLWQYKDGAWKITRVISYDHHAAAK